MTGIKKIFLKYFTKLRSYFPFSTQNTFFACFTTNFKAIVKATKKKYSDPENKRTSVAQNIVAERGNCSLKLHLFKWTLFPLLSPVLP